MLTPVITCQDWGKCAEEDKTEFTTQLEIARSANDPEMLQHSVSVVEDWCHQTETLLLETQKDPEDLGNLVSFGHFISHRGRNSISLEQRIFAHRL